MKELKIIAGRHKCGKIMDMRIADVKDDNKNVISWIIYGVCKRCNVVLVSDLFLQAEEPLLNLDFSIDYDLVSKESKSKNL